MRKYAIYQIIKEDFFVLKHSLVMECYTQPEVAHHRAKTYLEMRIAEPVLRKEENLSTDDNVALETIFNDAQELNECFNLSTGDIVKLDEKYYLCLSCGWKRVA